ncbi:uncharacterized protein ACRADG_006314 isoform 3-T3 [Cochliomyia hominivorax]
MLASLGFNEAVANGRSRRRFGQSTTKLPSDETTQKTSAEQIIAASTNTEPNKYRRGGAYSTDTGDYIYNTADINLIQPENKPLHTKITAKYTSSITIPHDSLEDSETAEEYVAKAMGMYGSRLREPIRVPYEPEPTQAEQPQQHPQQQQQQQKEQESLHQENQKTFEQYHHQQQNELNNQKEELKQNNYEYYTYTQKEVPQQKYSNQEEQLPPQSYHQYESLPTLENDAKQQLEEHLQAQLQEQIKQAQQIVKDREQEKPEAEQNEENASPAPVYEKDPVTRSYNIYEEHTEGYDPSQQSVVDRNYRTKYIYKPVPQYQENQNENEERIRVSASTEIPKAEIMKQIEKSVIKYMKELEAEGKIIAAPQNQESKTYFKVITVPGSDEKRIASTTNKPTKYIASPSSNYQEPYKHLPSHSIPQSSQKYHKNSSPKTSYQAENENTYQAPVADLAPNVEFIYKIKTKTPLHTATVKTVSKPYNLPIKSYEQFDHSSALKNLEEFDLSHVVTTPDPEEHLSASSNKPNKLYFNSEIYHDINSLPYKQKQRVEAEYRKLKAAAENHPDYKGYAVGNSQSGYYAEPPSDREAEREASSTNVSEDGYPLANPYQHVLKKDAMPGKYDDSNESYDQQQPRSHKYKPLEFDSYNPKFNNNPESYGYQQTYKTHLSNRHAPGKRGKRGGSSSHLSANKKSSHRAALKDYETNVALRPPPKN